MVKKSDLRFVRTDKAIRDAYMALKMQKQSNIKLKDLCNEALINVNTFYTHYDSIKDLHEHVCIRAIETMLDESPDVNLAFTNTEEFVVSHVQTLQKHRTQYLALFEGNLEKEISLIEKGLIRRYLKEGKHQGKEQEIIFAIAGAARLLLTDQSSTQIKKAVELIRKVIL